jgi:pimeloyl-ACP methyl ester carboxylesterase
VTALDPSSGAGSDVAGGVDVSTPPPIAPTGLTYPGARRPDRSRWVRSDGIHLATYEWGDPDAPVIVIAHGGFDFAGTLDQFAPLLADAGWRCVAWDARGHGCSEHATLYSWAADNRDVVAVLDTVTDDPVVFLGHSKGGGLLLDLAHALPHRMSHLINLDGLPSRNSWPDLAEHDRTRMLHGELEGWLDHRRRVADAVRKPGAIRDLAERRQRMNPRLPVEWLEYLVPIGAAESDDGWRWRIDPSLRLGGFGPWRPEWAMERLPGIGVPVLGVLGLELETMGWGTRPEDVLPNLPAGARFHALDGVGHFVHIEQPRLVADLVLDFLGTPPASGGGRPRPGVRSAGFVAPARGANGPDEADTPAEGCDPAAALSAPALGGAAARRIRHGKVCLALHTLRAGEGRPLLQLVGLGEPTPACVPTAAEAWPGPVLSLDLTGHGASTVPRGGGYTAEILMADVDAVLAEIGPSTVLGRGIGGYVALLIAGGRPALVRGAVLTDGPGLVGGGIRPGSACVPHLAPSTMRPPDPFALFELSRDPRPPDYAIQFVRLANEWSGLDHPIAVCALERPEWLVAAVGQPGVLDTTVDAALAYFAGVPDRP